jgi:hypothetical protein
MAILEIAKIQVRRGDARTTGLPQLDTGEFGWAIVGTGVEASDPQLFIGNKTADGAIATRNIRILTEDDSSNLFDYATNYTYRGNSGSTVVTGANSNGDTQRSVQSKLDETVSIADFGVVSSETDTLTADGAPVYKQIQQAIDEIFLNSDRTKPVSRKRLLFPAGTYNITGTIYVPPYATIIGEGPDKTVLQVTTSTAYNLMQLVDETSTSGDYIMFVPGNAEMTNWVSGIHIEGINFNYAASAGLSTVKPLLSIDCAKESIVTNCKFSGLYNPNGLANDSYAGIEIRGQGELSTNGLIIQNSVFDSVKLAVTSAYDVENILVENNKFYNLSRGIQWTADGFDATTGPSKTRIINNNFENIEREAIYVGSNNGFDTDHVTAFNSYKEVGNNILGDNNQDTAIVNFVAPGNVSIEEKFDRESFIKTYGLAETVYVSPIKGNTFIDSGKATLLSIENTQYTPPATVVKLPYAGNDQTVKVQYIISKPTLGISRKGDLTVSISLDNYATITDNYTYFGPNDGNITFAADLNIDTNTVNISYTSTNSLGTLEFRYSNLQ